MTEVQNQFHNLPNRPIPIARQIFENTELNPILAWYLSSMNLLPYGVIGSDWDACLHHGITTLHQSCHQMSIFAGFLNEMTASFMEDVKAGRFGKNGVEIKDISQWVRLGSLEAIINTICHKFLKRPVSPEELQEFDKHQTANQLLPATQAEGRMTQKTYNYLKKLIAKYRVYILTNNRESILNAFITNSKVVDADGNINQVGLDFGEQLACIAKDTIPHQDWKPDEYETASQTQIRESRHEKPYTHTMSKALALSFKLYKRQLQEALTNDITLKFICNLLSIEPSDLIRYLLIRISHIDRIFIGDSLISDKGTVDNFNGLDRGHFPYFDPSRSVPPTIFEQVLQKKDNLAETLNLNI